MSGKKEVYSGEEFVKKLETELKDDYQIGLHQVGVFGTKESVKEVRKNNFLKRILPIRPKDYLKSIMKSGLKNRWEKLDHTVMTFGSATEIAKNKDGRKDTFLDYDYTREITEDIDRSKEVYDIIVAIPSTAEIDEKKYQLGYLEYAQDEKCREKSSIQDTWLAKSDVPPEFIYGYVIRKNGEYMLKKNGKHISLMTKEEKEAYIKGMLEKKNINLDTMEKLEEREDSTDIMGLSDMVNHENLSYNLEEPKKEEDKNKDKTYDDTDIHTI